MVLDAGSEEYHRYTTTIFEEANEIFMFSFLKHTRASRVVIAAAKEME